MINSIVEFQDLGLIDYKKCWDYQTKLFEQTVQQKIYNRKNPENKTITKNYLLFCEHPHVYTLGKSGDEKNLLINKSFLKDKKASYYEINRGGDITYHGPGQLVVYPIFDLDHFFTDIHKYLRTLEEVIIATLSDYGILGFRIDGQTGVWVGKGKFPAQKICAFGVRASRWVTMHGMSLNVNTNLDYFKYIVPCGINDKGVTSIKEELGRKVLLSKVKERIARHFINFFEVETKI